MTAEAHAVDVRMSLSRRSFFVLGTSAAAFGAATALSPAAEACCAAFPEGKPVVHTRGAGPVYGSASTHESDVAHALAAAALLPILRRMTRSKCPASQ